ncbi:hypothetical protein GOV14_05000 [Candidatus Pacearchaeota archaeon]|nr:hypothetical protein [Candidatus Pacearchaeota archaeon]
MKKEHFNFKKICFAVALLGIFILLIIANFSKPKTIEIKDINKNLLNKQIHTSGQIKQIQNYQGFQVVTIKQENNTIQVLIDKPLNLTKNQLIEVTGNVQNYKSNLQINARIISS